MLGWSSRTKKKQKTKNPREGEHRALPPLPAVLFGRVWQAAVGPDSGQQLDRHQQLFLDMFEMAQL